MKLQKSAQSNLSLPDADLMCTALRFERLLLSQPDLITVIATLVMREKKAFYQLQKLKEQDMEALFARAHECYRIGQYEAAVIFFQTLAFYNCFDLRAWLGLAASFEQQHQFSEAIICHRIHDQLSFETSSSLFHAYDCYDAIRKIAPSLINQSHDCQPQRSYYQEKKRQQQNW